MDQQTVSTKRNRTRNFLRKQQDTVSNLLTRSAPILSGIEAVDERGRVTSGREADTCRTALKEVKQLDADQKREYGEKYAAYENIQVEFSQLH